MKRFANDAHKAHMVTRLNSSATCLAPFKIKRVRIPASASWLISEMKRLMRERDPRIKGIAFSTKDKTKWIKYKKIKNQVNYSIIVCKKDYYHSYFESNIGKIKATWRVARGGGGVVIPFHAQTLTKFMRHVFESAIVGETSGKRNFHDETQIIHESRMPHEINHASHAFRYSRITFLCK